MFLGSQNGEPATLDVGHNQIYTYINIYTYTSTRTNTTPKKKIEKKLRQPLHIQKFALTL